MAMKSKASSSIRPPLTHSEIADGKRRSMFEVVAAIIAYLAFTSAVAIAAVKTDSQAPAFAAIATVFVLAGILMVSFVFHRLDRYTPVSECGVKEIDEIARRCRQCGEYKLRVVAMGRPLLGEDLRILSQFLHGKTYGDIDSSTDPDGAD